MIFYVFIILFYFIFLQKFDDSTRYSTKLTPPRVGLGRFSNLVHGTLTLKGLSYSRRCRVNRGGRLLFVSYVYRTHG